MEKMRLLYLPSYGSSKPDADISAMLAELLPAYDIITLKGDVNAPSTIIESIDLEFEGFDLMVANGFGCFFAHQISACNRICLNPILSASETDAYSSMTDKTKRRYEDMEESQYSYGIEEDVACRSYCFGVYDQKNMDGLKDFNTMYFPNIRTHQKGECIDEALITEHVLPIISILEQSRFQDPEGMRYLRFGRILQGIDLNKKGVLEPEYTVRGCVRIIADGAFIGTGIKKIILGRNVRHLGKDCFANSSVQVIDMSKSAVEVIPERCFDGCHELREVKFNNRIYSIQKEAFAETALGQSPVEVPETIQYIAPSAFPEGTKIAFPAQKFSKLLDIATESYIAKQYINPEE